jgi:hypothetical protein
MPCRAPAEQLSAAFTAKCALGRTLSELPGLKPAVQIVDPTPGAAPLTAGG